MDVMTGQITIILFFSPDSGYTVANFKPRKGKTITISGHWLPDAKTCVEIIGQMATDEKYGNIFRCECCTPIVFDLTRGSVVQYLSSSLVKGVGAKIAERIYDKFGKETFNIIESEPRRLAEVKGISSAKAIEISKSYKENKEYQDTMKLLVPAGLNIYQIGKLIKMHGKAMLTRLQRNPYSIIRELYLTFEEADKIALNLGIKADSPLRIDYAIKAVLDGAQVEGDTGLTVKEFDKRVKKLLGREVKESAITDRLEKKKNKYIYATPEGVDEPCIFPLYIWNCEDRMSKSVVDMICAETDQIDNVDEQISKIEEKKGIKLDKTQAEAIKTALNSSFAVITGGPGTGKTTIMQFIADVYELAINKPIHLLAPTGKAARKLEEYTGRKASTMHSALGIFDVNKGKTGEEEKTKEFRNCLIVVDEFSMVDTFIASAFFKAVKDNVKVVLVGDVDQLPSVGPGAVLDDIIDSGIADTVRLTKTFRMAGESSIFSNTLKVRDGECTLIRDSSFEAYILKDASKCKEKLKELYKQRVKEYGINNVMMLLPYKKGLAGTDTLNKELQEVYNPHRPGNNEVVYGDTTFREGDIVMQVNQNTRDASNGDIGKITEIITGTNNVQVIVSINGEDVVYEMSDLHMLSLAYTYTIHKSQGSEAKAVITCINSLYPKMLYRSIPYVAFSRAKQHIDVICDKGLTAAIKTTDNRKRLTLLKTFLYARTGRLVPESFM